jgi:DNA-binding transcriptional LysR family regulator
MLKEAAVRSGPFGATAPNLRSGSRGRLRVTAAEGVRAAVLSNGGIVIASEWMFSPEVADGTVKAVLLEWELPAVDLWAVFPAGRAATTKARTFTSFVQEVMHQPAAAGNSG